MRGTKPSVPLWLALHPYNLDCWLSSWLSAPSSKPTWLVHLVHRRDRFIGILAVLLVSAILFSGCLSEEEGPPPLNVLVDPPEGPVITGDLATFSVRVVEAHEPVQSLGLAWASSSTDAIRPNLLIEDAFDGVQWAQSQDGTTATITLEETPELPFLWVRGVATTPSGNHWSNEQRVPLGVVEPPPVPALRIQGLPEETYKHNMHNIRLNITDVQTNATQAGLAWTTMRTGALDPGLFTLSRFDGHITKSGPIPLPGMVRFDAWSVPVNTTLYLRAWVQIDGLAHWSNEAMIVSQPPPVVDHKVEDVDRTIRIAASLLPVELLDSFDPEDLRVQVGESVQWVNEGHGVHTATHDANETAFNTGNLGPGATSEPFRFLVPGEYTYECRVHPLTMKGTITVEP